MEDPLDVRFWTVLRCSGKDTLDLASWLRDEGASSWTPFVQARRRLPRLRKVVHYPKPVLPSFVFVDAGEDHKIHAWQSRCPLKFSRFHLNGVFPQISDRALDPVREYCRSAAEKEGFQNSSRPDPVPPEGTHVVCMGGVFDGLRGVVMGRRPGGAIVEFREFSFRAVIPPFLFKLDTV